MLDLGQCKRDNLNRLFLQDTEAMTAKNSKPSKQEHNSGNYESIESKLKEGIYKECISTHKWALRIIIALVIVLAGYAVYRNDKEYRQVLSDAKEARNKAEESCEKAREYELKAQEALGSIDQSVANKLEQIERTGNEQIQTLFKEAERQRTISGYLALAELVSKRKKHDRAAEYYRLIVEELKEEDIPEVYNNWGAAYLALAQQKEEKDAEDLLKQAEEKFLKAESIKSGGGAYNLACVYAHRGNEDKCQEWLKVGEKAGTLPTREHAMADDDLKSVRDKDWFKMLRWKGE